MTREEKFYEMVASSESSIQNFNDFFDDKAIVWAAHKIKFLDARVKALESENESLREIVSESCAAVGSTCRCSTKASLDFMAGVPGEIRMTVDALQERANLMDSALREIRSAAIRGIHGDFLDVNVVGIANKALEETCQK